MPAKPSDDEVRARLERFVKSVVDDTVKAYEEAVASRETLWLELFAILRQLDPEPLGLLSRVRLQAILDELEVDD